MSTNNQNKTNPEASIGKQTTTSNEKQTTTSNEKQTTTSNEKQTTASNEQQTTASNEQQTTTSGKLRKGAPKRPNVRRIAVVGVLSGLTLALALIPQIGYIVVPGLGIQITIVHIPVIIAGIIEGPVVGAFVGLIFGLSSLYTALTSPLPIAFAFMNPLVSILPRIFIGVVSWYAYRGLTLLTRDKARSVSIGLAAAAGTITNTIGVLGMIYVLYAKQFLEAIGLQSISPALAIFGLAMPNFPLELAAAVLLSIPVALAVKRMKRE